jgi:hypothetical protein
LKSCVNVVFELPVLLLLEVGIEFAVEMIVIEVLVALMTVVVVLTTNALLALVTFVEITVPVELVEIEVKVALGATKDEMVIFLISVALTRGGITPVALTMLELAPIVTEVTLGTKTVTCPVAFTVGIVIFVATPVELFVEDVLEVAIVVLMLATVALPASVTFFEITVPVELVEIEVKVALRATEDVIVIFLISVALTRGGITPVALTMLELAPIVTEVTLGTKTVKFPVTFTVGIVIFVATPVELFVEDVLEVAIVVLMLATVALPASVTFFEITVPVELVEIEVKVALRATKDEMVIFPTSVALTRGGITPIVTEVTLKADGFTFSVTLTVALRIVINALPVVSLVGIATTVE